MKCFGGKTCNRNVNTSQLHSILKTYYKRVQHNILNIIIPLLDNATYGKGLREGMHCNSLYRLYRTLQFVVLVCCAVIIQLEQKEKSLTSMIIRTIAIKYVGVYIYYIKKDSAGLNNNNKTSAVSFLQSC